MDQKPARAKLFPYAHKTGKHQLPAFLIVEVVITLAFRIEAGIGCFALQVDGMKIPVDADGSLLPVAGSPFYLFGIHEKIRVKITTFVNYFFTNDHKCA